MSSNNRKPARVAIIGPEQVSATDAYSLLVSGLIKELVLIGTRSRRLIAELEELRTVVEFPHETKIWKGTYADAAEASVAIITFGDAKPHTVNVNRSYVRGAAMRLNSAGFKGVLIVAREPVHKMALAALEGSGLPENKVIGLGTGHNHHNIGHVTWCTALHSDAAFMDNCNADCPYFERVLVTPEMQKTSRRTLRSFAPEKVAACVTQVCDAVISDSRMIIPVFAIAEDGEFHDVPCVIGRTGIRQVVTVPEKARTPKAIHTPKTRSNPAA